MGKLDKPLMVTRPQLIVPKIGLTRTEIDFAWHIRDTVATDRDAGWRFIVDQLNTHCSESLVRYVALLENIPRDTLGIKGKSGILKSMATRQQFLADESHRVHFVYLPKHRSWLNQIEVIFGIINRRAVKRGSFASLTELRTRLLEFIAYFNATFARPFRGTYTGYPTHTAPARKPKTWKQYWKSAKITQIQALVA